MDSYCCFYTQAFYQSIVLVQPTKAKEGLGIGVFGTLRISGSFNSEMTSGKEETGGFHHSHSKILVLSSKTSWKITNLIRILDFFAHGFKLITNQIGFREIISRDGNDLYFINPHPFPLKIAGPLLDGRKQKSPALYEIHGRMGSKITTYKPIITNFLGNSRLTQVDRQEDTSKHPRMPPVPIFQ